MIAALPLNEDFRLQELDKYRILDTDPDQAYDDLTKLAADICKAPIAIISMVDTERQWFKSRFNCEVKESPREFSFCAHAIHSETFFSVSDLAADSRFCDNPFVSGEPHVRFYAGAPLITPGKAALGTICVLDYLPRELTEPQVEALQALSRVVIARLESRWKEVSLTESVEKNRQQETVVQALRDSGYKAQLLGDAFSSIHWSMDAALTVFQPSERWLEFTGIEQTELDQEGWWATVHPNDLMRFMAEVDLARQSGEAKETEVRLKYHDHSWRWMLVRAVPLKDKHGQIVRWLGTNVDIHEQYLAKEALMQSEERYRLALEAAELGTWDIFLENNHLTWDPRCRKQAGVAEDASPNALSIRAALQCIHPEDRRRVLLASQRAMRNEPGLIRIEYRVVWPDQSVHWLTSHGQVQFAGTGRERKPIRITGINHDITLRRKTSLALQMKSELLTAVSESLELFLAQGDWNQALARLLRCALLNTSSKFGLIGVLTEHLPELRVLAAEGLLEISSVSTEFRERTAEAYQKQGYFVMDRLDPLFGDILSTGKTTLNNHVSNGSRSVLPPEFTEFCTYIAMPIRQGAEVVGLIVLANGAEGYSDETLTSLGMLVQQAGVLCDSYRHNERSKFLKHEHERLELQLRQAQKMEAIGQLAGGVAHDFNNLLTVITGHSERILMQYPITSPQRDSLLQIAMAGERAAQLTRQLLTFSRRQLFQPAPVEINPIILEIVKMLSRMIGENVAIRCDLGGNLPRILADVGMMEQVVMNLVINARDAMPDGGEIVIRTGVCVVDGESCEQKEGSHLGRSVWLSVADTGCGIRAEHLAHIFEPFYTTKGVGEGTGLGLATVYGIVQQHGGWVEVDSTENVGTKFTVLTPSTDQLQINGNQAVLLPSTGGNETILLVEDEEFVRMLARQILEEGGYTVLEAATGAEALEIWLADQGQIALLLTDMVMPGHLSGRDVADNLRKTQPDLPVIFSSGYSQELLKTGVELRNGIAFLPKPYRPQELLCVVREALDRKAN